MVEFPDVTALMDRAGRGDAQAAADLFPIVYEQLCASAARKMAAERADHTLQPTALVHEAYLRLVGNAATAWDGRAHFYAAQIVRLRFFAGLDVRDVAQALGITDRTVRRDWAVARAWLYRALSEGERSGSQGPDEPPQGQRRSE